MKKNTSISFVVPAYNCAKFLPDAINSIFNGNFTVGDEVIIVDDASTDNTSRVAKSLQKKYPVVHIFGHHYNKGSASAGRNTGIDNSKNDLIFCLDADNVLCPNSVPRLKQYMIDKKADAAAFGELHFFIENKIVTHKWTYKDKITLYDAINNTQATPCASGNYLFTKASWIKAGRYNESAFTIAYDSLDFGLRQLFSGAKMVTMPSLFYFHRYGYNSTFVKEIKKINPSLAVLQIILPFLHIFKDEDVNYVMSRAGRCTWFKNTKKHPLRLKRTRLKRSSYFPNKLFNKIRKVKILLTR